MKLFLENGKKAVDDLTAPENYEGKGKQTVKQLVKQGHGVTNIEISDKNIKDFEGIARKYGVDFAVVKDATDNPPKHLVFFKSRAHTVLAVAAAFKDYSSKHMAKTNEKPSLLGMLRDLMEKVKDQVLDQTKHKDRGRDL
ncbi:MAG: PcfB family protein [Peptococcaceae bacterium]|nr:PcfB family protein [Peptococcaceae bacterium]